MSFNNRGKIIWTLNITNGVWGCPGGNTKQYKADDMDLRWHPNPQSITLSGKLKHEIGDKLNSMASVSEELRKSSEGLDEDRHVEKEAESHADLNANSNHPGDFTNRSTDNVSC